MSQKASPTPRDKIRNIAIIAHVDHGKTTLVDALLKEGGAFREGKEVVDRVMDSNDQERERGITILAKCTSIRFDEYLLQIVDTPGHADFGGEVERSLQMVDGVLLLVDAAEGPLPQTRFVLRKSLARGLPLLLAINKVDRSDARAEEVRNEVYDLLIDLGADEEQLEFPVLYTVGSRGQAGASPDDLDDSLVRLVNAITDTIPPPEDKTAEPFSLQVNQLSYDNYMGRLVIGRVLGGQLAANATVQIANPNKEPKTARLTGLFRFEGIERVSATEVLAGDIVVLSGIDDVVIGDTLSMPDQPVVYDVIKVDEPTVAMVFQVNDSPWAGRSGKYVTSRHLKDRLEREAFANVSISIQPGETPDRFRVLGRGELQLAVLIESMRREGYEMCVRNPEVVTRDGESGQEEPVERLVVDVPVENIGAVTQTLGARKAEMLNQTQEGSHARLEYRIPTRGLFGLRSILLTATRGTAVMHSVMDGWTPWKGPMTRRNNGALIADRDGATTPYAIFHLQDRGEFFVPPGTPVYKGMVVGEHNRDNDLNINVVREKKMTNVRASGKDEASVCAPPRDLSLERYIEWIREGELVEVTPDRIVARVA